MSKAITALQNLVRFFLQHKPSVTMDELHAELKSRFPKITIRDLENAIRGMDDVEIHQGIIRPKTLTKYTVILVQHSPHSGEPAYAYRHSEGRDRIDAQDRAINSYVMDNAVPEEMWEQVEVIYVFPGHITPIEED